MRPAKSRSADRIFRWMSVGLLGAGCIISAGAAFVAVVGGEAKSLSAFQAMSLGFAAGMVGVGASAFFWLYKPLREVAESCAALHVGDLSLTVPEKGTGELRQLAAVINGLAADFQEVLLLFVHLLRSARRAMPHLRAIATAMEEGVDRDLVEKALADANEMFELVSEFKYYRVKIDGDDIIDQGVQFASSSHLDDEKPLERDRTPNCAAFRPSTSVEVE